MYSWGYLKNAALAKLDLDQTEANELKLINRFVYYANEVITQICSAIKPKRKFYEITIDDSNVGKIITIDDGEFISFSDDLSTLYVDGVLSSCTDVDLLYKGYNQFVCYTKGKYHIGVCLGTACYVKGSGDIINKIKEKLGVEIGECTPDGKFSLEATRCIGACGLAPVLTVNDEVYGRLTPSMVDDIISKYENM
jgi:hypothetical protein